MASKPSADRPIVPSSAQVPNLNMAALSGEIGLNLALPLLIFMIVGIRLDRAIHTSPLFTLLGVALSMSASVMLIARLISRVNRKGQGRP